MHFVSPTKGSLTLAEVASDIKDFCEAMPEQHYRLIVGSDSQPRTARHATLFVTAIVIHRVGKGARFFYHKQPYKKTLSFKQRIFMEASYALEVVQALEEELGQLGHRLPIEIHLDIGEGGETKILIKEVIGWITQSGYTARIKPDSYGAFKVADRYTKF